MLKVTHLQIEKPGAAAGADPSTMLMSMDQENYSGELVSAMKGFMAKKKGDAVYLTFNKPANSLAELFQHLDHKNRLLFLDVISKHTGQEGPRMENAFFFSFPGDLTGVMMALTRTLKMHDFKFLFLDSLPSVLIYNDERTTTRFVHAVSAMCKQHSVNLVLFSSEDIPESLSSSVSSLSGSPAFA